MKCSPSLEKLIDQIKAAVLPAPELMQLDEDCLACRRSRRDLFDQLIDSDSDEATLPYCSSSKRCSMRPESPPHESTGMEVEE
jgi:hypothetical protein